MFRSVVSPSIILPAVQEQPADVRTRLPELRVERGHVSSRARARTIPRRWRSRHAHQCTAV